MELKLTCDVDGLKQFYDMVRQKEGHPEESTKIINQLLLKAGFEKVRLKRSQRSVLELNDNIKKYTEQKEIEIASSIARGFNAKKIKSMDISKARYLIEAALMKFDCHIENRHLCKKQIDEWLGYSSRTMRVQQQLFGKEIYVQGTEESKILAEIYNDLIGIIGM